MAEPLFIPTEREDVILRELSSDVDDDTYFEAYNASRPEIEIFDPESVNKHKSIEDTRNARLNAGDNIRMGIWDRDVFVGSVNSRPDEEGTEIGYWTDSRRTGNGYATLAAKALSQHEKDRFPNVHAAVIEGNEASIRVLEKSGFIETAHEAGRIIFAYNPIAQRLAQLDIAGYPDIYWFTDISAFKSAKISMDGAWRIIDDPVSFTQKKYPDYVHKFNTDPVEARQRRYAASFGLVALEEGIVPMRITIELPSEVFIAKLFKAKDKEPQARLEVTWHQPL